ncbi:hypothetical protein BH09BAC2_BH09BAC2_09900 [soil metagenome]
MGLDDLISIEFSKKETKTIDEALAAIEGIIKNKVINLTGEERQLYGKIGDRTEGWIDKVKGYME